MDGTLKAQMRKKTRNKFVEKKNRKEYSFLKHIKDKSRGNICG